MLRAVHVVDGVVAILNIASQGKILPADTVAALAASEEIPQVLVVSGFSLVLGWPQMSILHVPDLAMVVQSE